MKAAIPETLDKYTEAKSVSRLASFCAKFALAVMVLGSAVRATDSGLACPDWPLCFGSPLPYFDTRIFLEWFHRLVAGIFSLVAFYLGYRILKTRENRQNYSVMIFAVLLLLVWQIILGALTVLELLNPKIVAWHLMNAVMLFSVLQLITIKAAALQFRNVISQGLVSRKIGVGLGLLTTMVFLQLFLGGMVATNEAGLICPDFPQCFGQWWPNISWLGNLQMTHRFVGFSIVTLSMIMSLALVRTPLPPNIRRTVTILPVLMACQVLLGALNVLWYLPAWASVAHLALALMIYALLLSASAEYHYIYSGAKVSSPSNGFGLVAKQMKA